MFGTNPLRKLDSGDGTSLWVQSVFGTLQGEGPLTGRPSVFVRLAGCHLRCFFCDTDFESSVWEPNLNALFSAIEIIRGAVKTRLLVLTGGEPLRQNLLPFLERAMHEQYEVQIETAGSFFDARLEPLFEAHDDRLLLVCSPKTGTLHAGIRRWCHDYKYIVAAGEVDEQTGFPCYSTQIRGLKAQLYVPEPSRTAQIWLQPRMEYLPTGTPDEARTAANTAVAVAMCLRHGHRLSLQTHKIVGVD